MQKDSTGKEKGTVGQAGGSMKSGAEEKSSGAMKDEKSSGTMHNEMILGDRFLKQEYEGTMMGMPFHGGGLVGYDNVNQRGIYNNRSVTRNQAVLNALGSRWVFQLGARYTF